MAVFDHHAADHVVDCRVELLGIKSDRDSLYYFALQCGEKIDVGHGEEDVAVFFYSVLPFDVHGRIGYAEVGELIEAFVVEVNLCSAVIIFDFQISVA